ncbi:hypothetical protein ACWCPT_35315 [Streptomyces sp. NPDC002308]
MASAVDRSVLTQAFTWANSASAAGIALSAGTVGRLVDGPGGAGAGFAVPFLALTLTAALARSSRRALTAGRAGEAGRCPAPPDAA